MNKHKHYDTIIAYANGEEIQFYENDTGNWVPVSTPSFFPEFQYRVKPKKVTKKRWGRMYREGDEIKLYTTTSKPDEYFLVVGHTKGGVVDWDNLTPYDWIGGWKGFEFETDES